MTRGGHVAARLAPVAALAALVVFALGAAPPAGAGAAGAAGDDTGGASEIGQDSGGGGAGGRAPAAVPPDAASWDPPKPVEPPESSSQRCHASEACRVEGRCAADAAGCVAASDEHCGRSLWCRDYGLCRATEGGRCTAVLDRDCAGASVCRDRGLCFARGGVCVSAAVEGQHSRPLDAMRAPADDPGCSDCPKERYSPGMMAAGIALSGLSGVGLVMGFLFSKPFSLADSSPRAGYILWGVAGGLALLGIPLAIAGAHKVERKKSGARAEHERDGAHVRAIPRIAVGIMSSTFTWSF